MPLLLSGSDIVHLDKNTFMWVHVTHFVIDLDLDNALILESLVNSPGYAHDYASPFPSETKLPVKPVHGRWVLSAIDADRFHPSTADRAEFELDLWANKQDWTDPAYRQPAAAMQRLRAVYSLFSVGDVYKLCNPGHEVEHDYGFVTGGLGFHEFVVIDRASAALHVIVASDD